MLTLSGGVGEIIYIGDDLCVTVYDALALSPYSWRADACECGLPGALSLHMHQVEIDSGAPPSVAVHREEIYLRVLRDAGERPPAMPFSAWLHQALHAPSGRAAA